MCAGVQHRWLETLLLRSDGPFWELGRPGWEEAGMGADGRTALWSGDQAPAKAEDSGSGAADAGGGRGGISKGAERKRAEWADQYLIYREVESPGTARQGRCDNPAMRLKTDTADVGTDGVFAGADGAPGVVAGVLPLRSVSREPGSKAGGTGQEEGQASAAAVQETELRQWQPDWWTGVGQ